MKNKILSFLLALVAAFGLWLYVITTVSPNSTATYFDIPVVMENEAVLNERGLMITNVSAKSVTMRLSGNRSDLIRVNKGNITLKIDLSRVYEPGVNNLSYSTTYPGDVPSNAFVVESKDPGTIQVTVERRVSKEVPVEVRWIGSADEGFMTDRENRVLDYSSVTVIGPDSVVNKIDAALVEVDLGGRRESLSESYHYTLCDANREPVDAQLITTNVEEVHLDVKILRVEDVNLTCTVVEGGGATLENTQITFDPASIRISGSEAALAAMGSQLNVGTINLGEITKNQTMTFAVNLPEGMTNLTGVNEVTVTVEMSGLATRELVIEHIGSVNVPEGMELEMITEKMTVIARGPIEEIQKLTADNVRAQVDFTGAEAGTATYKASITYGEGFEKVGTLKADPVSAVLRPGEG